MAGPKPAYTIDDAKLRELCGTVTMAAAAEQLGVTRRYVVRYCKKHNIAWPNTRDYGPVRSLREEEVRALMTTHTLGEAATELGVGPRRLKEFCRDASISWPNHRIKYKGDDVPQEAIDWMKSQEVVSVAEMARQFNVSRGKARRWYTLSGVDVPRHQALPKMERAPDDWFEVAPRMTLTELEKHYNASSSKIRRWVSETNVVLRHHNPPSTWRTGLVQAPLPSVSNEAPAQAAHYIRRWFKNVHRADIIERENGTTWGELRGLPAKGRGLYYVDGVGVVPSAEVIDLARARGWRYDSYE